jgi:hypothetical protein
VLPAFEHEPTLEDALRAALAGARAPREHDAGDQLAERRARRGEGEAAAPRCLVCSAPARRERLADGSHETACTSCGSVLEEPAPPRLRLV